MTIERTSFPSPVSVVTVNTAKSHLRVEHTDDDLLIEGYIDAAYHLVEKFTGVFLQETKVSIYFDELMEYTNLHVGPNALVDKVLGADDQQTHGLSYIKEDGDREFLNPPAYQFDGVSYPARLRVEDLPTVKDTLNAWRVDMKAGYNNTDRPEALVSAMLLIIGHLYENRQDVGQFKTHEIPMSSRYLMNPYRLQSFS